VNAQHKRSVQGEQAPDANEEYLLYQTVVGTWPLQRMNDDQLREYVRRIQEYMLKAMREAKVNSSWIEPNEAWHEAVLAFISAVIDVEAEHPLPDFVMRFIQRISPDGAINSLCQTVLKLTVPGVPDLYQGTEIWDFSLVDPDNRRPVDYDLREKLLRKLKVPAGQLFNRWRDGGIKLFVIRALLDLRRRQPQLFSEGEYVPVTVEGGFAEHCLAFERRHQGRSLLVLVPRLASKVGASPVGDAWADARVIPATRPNKGWRDVFTGATHLPGPDLALASVLTELPLAVLIDEDA
jgi:(1->4)-alpha-D-glucan 1-alpha-D-glucosylmutase